MRHSKLGTLSRGWFPLGSPSTSQKEGPILRHLCAGLDTVFSRSFFYGGSSRSDEHGMDNH